MDGIGEPSPDSSENLTTGGFLMTTDPNLKEESNSIPTFAPEDIEKNKTMAGLAYILFFLPLVACPDSQFGRFHANQGLLLLLLSLAGSVILTVIPIIGWMLLPLFGLGILALVIYGLVNGFGGKAKELPLIGKFRLLN
jgi:uncharacterized membrane protein